MKTLVSLLAVMGVVATAQADPVRFPGSHRPFRPAPPLVVIRDHGYRDAHFHRAFPPARVFVAPRPFVVVRQPIVVHPGRNYVTTSYDSADVGGRPDYRGSGLLLGAIAGAIVGNNSGTLHQNAWLGAAWGAGLGYVVGSVAEANARQVEARSPDGPYDVTPRTITVVPAAVPSAARVPDAPAQQANVINNYYYGAPATPMSAANQLFGR